MLDSDVGLFPAGGGKDADAAGQTGRNSRACEASNAFDELAACDHVVLVMSPSVLARMFHKHSHSQRVVFTNTLLQRGVGVWWRGPNRFSGFRQGVETVETVLRRRPAQNTPLKQGVNDKT